MMVEVVIVVRELGRVKPEYSLHFDLPEVPAVGTYISVNRPDHRDPLSEDLIVRHVWWRLFHPSTEGFSSGEPKLGRVKEIFVECDQAIGPYSHSTWRKTLENAKKRGTAVEEFEVERKMLSSRDPEDKE